MEYEGQTSTAMCGSGSSVSHVCLADGRAALCKSSQRDQKDLLRRSGERWCIVWQTFREVLPCPLIFSNVFRFSKPSWRVWCISMHLHCSRTQFRARMATRATSEHVAGTQAAIREMGSMSSQLCTPTPWRTTLFPMDEHLAFCLGLDDRDVAFMQRLRNLAHEALTWPHLRQKQRLVWAAALKLDAVPLQEQQLDNWTWTWTRIFLRNRILR